MSPLVKFSSLTEAIERENFFSQFHPLPSACIAAAVFCLFRITLSCRCFKSSVKYGNLGALQCNFEAKYWTLGPFLTKIQAYLIFCPLHSILRFHGILLNCTYIGRQHLRWLRLRGRLSFPPGTRRYPSSAWSLGRTPAWSCTPWRRWGPGQDSWGCRRTSSRRPLGQGCHLPRRSGWRWNGPPQESRQLHARSSHGACLQEELIVENRRNG